MSPFIKGIVASGISGHLTPAYSGPDGAYDALAVVTVPAGGLSSVEFVGIPQGYKHLQIRALMSTNSGSLEDTYWRFNNDSNTANYYSAHQIRGDGSSAAAQAFNIGNAGVGMMPYSGTSTVFTSAVVDILDYASVIKNKTVRGFSGYDANGSGYVFFRSGLWMNSSTPITSIKIGPNTATTFQQYSQFELYGVK